MALLDHPSLPRCPECRYELNGRRPLHCPECGYLLNTADDRYQSQLLADGNAEDRSALLAERLTGPLGGIAIIAGVVMRIFAWPKPSSTGMHEYLTWRSDCGIAIFTVACLWLRRKCEEPLWPVLGLLGLAWVVYGGFMLWSA